MGWVRLRNSNGALGIPRLGCQTDGGYMRVGVNGKLHLVHSLVAAAFLPPKPDPSCTVDHIDKQNGSVIKARSDNRASNLRWASPTQQNANKLARPKGGNRNSRPVWAWRVGEPEESAQNFASSEEAAQKLTDQTGTQFYSSSIRRVCRGENKQAGGYTFKYDTSNDEPQEIDGEVWKESLYCPLILVSNLGRVQLKHRDGNAVGLKFTSEPSKGEDYAKVTGNCKYYYVHRLVYYTFYPEDVDNADVEIIDHIDSNKTNNALRNLQGLTCRGNSVKIVRKPSIMTHHANKEPVEGRRVEGNEEWEWFASQADAARILTKRLGITISQPKICLSIHKGSKTRGYMFRKALKRPREDA